MLMRFGMGILLTPEENAIIAPIVKPCYAALGLANDYISFDVEWEEYQDEPAYQKTAMTNAVWLFMHWHGVDIPEARRLTRKVINRYEKAYLQSMHAFITGEGRDNIKLQNYLRAWSYSIPGNFAWSLRCPRYHPELCEEGAARLHAGRGRGREESPTSPVQDVSVSRELVFSSQRGSISDASVSDESSVWSAENGASSRSSISSVSDRELEHHVPKQVTLGDEVGSSSFRQYIDLDANVLKHLLAPAEYIGSLPSKGVREAFINALNVWMALPDHLVNQLKYIAQTLHNISLMYPPHTPPKPTFYL